MQGLQAGWMEDRMTLEKSTKLRGPRKVVGVCLSHGLGYELPHTLRSLQDWGGVIHP